MKTSDKMYNPPEEDFNEAGEEGEGGIPSPLTPWYRKPTVDNAKTFQDVLGPRPEYVNLKDNPSFNGTRIAICNVKFSSGEYGDFCFLGSLILEGDTDKPIKAVVIITGAVDVFARVAMVSNIINQGTPMIGTLRQAGRAWVLD